MAAPAPDRTGSARLSDGSAWLDTRGPGPPSRDTQPRQRGAEWQERPQHDHDQTAPRSVAYPRRSADSSDATQADRRVAPGCPWASRLHFAVSTASDATR